MAAVLVTGLTANVGEAQLREFFSYSGEVASVELNDAPSGRSALVAFLDAAALPTALLLTGATIVADDPPITVVEALGGALGAPAPSRPAADEPALLRVQTALRAMAAKGYVLGKDAVASVKAFDERTGVTSKIKETASELNERLRIAERSKAAADAASSAAASAAQAAKGAAASLAEKAKAFDEKHRVMERGRGLVSDASASVSNAAQRSGATDALKNLWSKGSAAAADAATAVKAKVASLSEKDAGVPVSTQATAE